MPLTCKRRPARGGAANVLLGGERPQHSRLAPGCHHRPGPRFRRLVRHLHRLDPRPVGELLLELAGDEAWLLDRLEAYSRLEPRLLQALDAHDWLDLPPRSVA